MKTGKITAKLRDAVPVCLMVEGEEVMRYKNIEFPDSLKELEMKDFQFCEMNDGKIIFEIHYEDGILPAVFPAARTRRSRKAKPAAPEIPQVVEIAKTEEAEAVEIETGEAPCGEPEAPVTMEINYNVTGIRRKELVAAIREQTSVEPEYKAAPSFAYEIGAYTVGKEGTLTGPDNPELLAALQEQGFTAAE